MLIDASPVQKVAGPRTFSSQHDSGNAFLSRGTGGGSNAVYRKRMPGETFPGRIVTLYPTEVGRPGAIIFPYILLVLPTFPTGIRITM
jgi:hypothetical protein